MKGWIVILPLLTVLAAANEQSRFSLAEYFGKGKDLMAKTSSNQLDSMKAHLRSWDDKLKADCPDPKAHKAKKHCATRLAIEQALTINDVASLGKKLSELRRQHAPKHKVPTLDELKAHLRSWDDKLKADCPDPKADKKKPQCATRLVIEQALALKDAAGVRAKIAELKLRFHDKMTVDELKAHLRAWDDKLKAECPDTKADKTKPQCATRLVIEQALALKDMQKLRNYVHRIFVHEMKAFAGNTMKHDAGTLTRMWSARLHRECGPTQGHHGKPNGHHGKPSGHRGKPSGHRGKPSGHRGKLNGRHGKRNGHAQRSRGGGRRRLRFGFNALKERFKSDAERLKAQAEADAERLQAQLEAAKDRLPGALLRTTTTTTTAPHYKPGHKPGHKRGHKTPRHPACEALPLLDSLLRRGRQGGKGSKDLLHGFLEELKRFRGSRGEGQGEDEGEDEPEWSNDMLKAWAVREQKLRADAETSGTKIDWEAEKRTFVEQWNATHASIPTLSGPDFAEDSAMTDTGAQDSSSQPDTASASVNATPYIIVGCIAAVALLAGVTVRQVRRRRRRMMGVLRLDDTLEAKLVAVDNDAQVLPMPTDYVAL